MAGVSLIPNRRGLAFKLALFILTATAIIFAAAFGYNYTYSHYCPNVDF